MGPVGLGLVNRPLMGVYLQGRIDKKDEGNTQGTGKKLTVDMDGV